MPKKLQPGSRSATLKTFSSYNPSHATQHRPLKPVTFPKRAVTFAEIRTSSVWAARCALRCAPIAARSLRHLIRDATLGAGHRAAADQAQDAENQRHGREVRWPHSRCAQDPQVQQPRGHGATLPRYVALYNHQLPQSAPGRKTPVQAMKEW